MYKRGAKGWLKHIDFIILDILSLLAAFGVAYLLRFRGGPDPLVEQHTGYLMVILAMDLAVCILFSTMHNVLKRGYYLEFAATIKHAVLVFAMMAVLLVAMKTSTHYSRLVMYGTPCLHVCIGYVTRVGYKLYLRKGPGRKKGRSVLLIAGEAGAEKIVHTLQTGNEPLRVSGVILSTRDARGETCGGAPVVANMAEAAQYICREWIDEVFLDAATAVKAQKLMAQCQEMGVVVHECLQREHDETQRQFVERIGGYTVLTSSVNTATVPEALVKRAMDIIGGLVGCMIALVIITVVGPQIKKASPGPILYAQERVGENGRRFRIYKLRSMHMDADAQKQALMDQNRMADGMMFKLDFDPRVIGNKILPDGTRKTGIGAFIRRTSLDEFPQFFNVLKGDMSLVGTRPPTVDEWERYALHHRARMAMKPGITGLWQVSGRSAITDFEEIVRLDTHYISTWNIGLDIKILLKTVLTVLRRDGAM